MAEGGTTGRGGSRAHDGAARWFRTGRSETVLALGTSLHSTPVTHVTHVPPGPEFCLSSPTLTTSSTPARLATEVGPSFCCSGFF